MSPVAALTPGLFYSVSNAEQEVRLTVEAQACKDDSSTVRLRLVPGQKYLRILQDGKTDRLGGGGGWCHFKTDLHDSGLLKFSRGPFYLACAEGNLTAVKDLPTSGAELWAVEEAPPQEQEEKAVALCQGSAQFGPFILEKMSDDVLRFRTADSRYLKLSAAGGVDTSGGGGAWCQFKMQPMSGENFSLSCQGKPSLCLGVSPWGALTGHDVPPEKKLFSMQEIALTEGKLLDKPRLTSHAEVDFDESVDFTPEQYKQFVEDGFVIAKGAVPKEFADAALARINQSLLYKFYENQHKEEDGEEKKERGHNPGQVGMSPEVQALVYGTPLWTLVQRLMGRGNVVRRAGSQIALLSPHPEAEPLQEGSIDGHQWHIDGMGKQEDQFSAFTLLVGIALSDQTQTSCGNLVVFPGSHHTLHSIVQQEVATPGTYPFLTGTGGGKPSLNGGLQTTLEVGDVVLAHQKLAHRVGKNCSPNIRYQAYFRLRHAKHSDHVASGALQNDLWAQYDSLQSRTTPY